MSDGESNFLQKCLNGDALLDDIDEYIDRWHEGEGDPDASLAEFLGFTVEEYKLWAEKPGSLEFILNARLHGISFDDLRGDDDRTYRIAARDLSTEDADELIQWLKKSGKIPT